MGLYTGHETAEVITCDQCKRPAKCLLRIGSDRADWCYAECEDCGDNLCAQHAIMADGVFLCDYCAQERALKEQRARHDWCANSACQICGLRLKEGTADAT